jgi:hypothetical protein
MCPAKHKQIPSGNDRKKGKNELQRERQNRGSGLEAELDLLWGLGGLATGQRNFPAPWPGKKQRSRRDGKAKKAPLSEEGCCVLEEFVIPPKEASKLQDM